MLIGSAGLPASSIVPGAARRSAVPASPRMHVGDRDLARVLEAAAAAGEDDRADGRDQQQQRGDLEREQEVVRNSRRSRPAVPKPAGSPVAPHAAPSLSIAVRPEPSIAMHSSTNSAPANSGRDDAQAGRRRARERLVLAADVGDDEDVEHHHRAGVDDDLRGGDELGPQQQEQRGQRQQVADERQHA